MIIDIMITNYVLVLRMVEIHCKFVRTVYCLGNPIFWSEKDEKQVIFNIKGKKNIYKSLWLGILYPRSDCIKLKRKLRAQYKLIVVRAQKIG